MVSNIKSWINFDTDQIENIGKNAVSFNKIADSQKSKSGDSFSEMLSNSINELNNSQKVSERAMADLASGQSRDLHSVAIAVDKAELTMKTMVEIRNKALSAYKDITRIQM
jgi:flagellar hook-basal body complex protein FliE